MNGPRIAVSVADHSGPGPRISVSGSDDVPGISINVGGADEDYGNGPAINVNPGGGKVVGVSQSCRRLDVVADFRVAAVEV
jgi:hypothetical protein